QLRFDRIKYPIVLGYATEVDLRARNNCASIAIDDRDHRNETFFAQDLTVFEILFSYSTNRPSIDIDIFRGNFPDLPCNAVYQINDTAVAGHDHMFFIYTG